MVSRRTRSLIDLLCSALALAVYRRQSRDHPHSPRVLAVGAVAGVVQRYCQEHDVAGLRRSRLRRALLAAATFPLIRVLDEATKADFAVGNALGGIAYRLYLLARGGE